MSEMMMVTEQPKRRTQLLRKRRVKQQAQEEHIRNHMHKISTELPPDSIYSSDSGYSFHTASSADSVETMETSLLSQSRSISRGQKLRWNRFHITFSFSLLTSQLDAPPEGIYNKEEQVLNDDSSVMSSNIGEKSMMLESIMLKVRRIAQMALEERGGNVVMKCSRTRPPFIISVNRDSSYTAPRNRPGIVRSIVNAAVQVSITDIESFTSSSKVIARVLVKQALIEAVQRKILDPQ